MKTLNQLLEDINPKRLKKQHTPKNRFGGTYNPAPKLFKTAQKLGFRRVQVGERKNNTKDAEGNAVVEKYPVHHMVHPEIPGHHLIISRKGFIHRGPKGGLKTGANAGSLLNVLEKTDAFHGAAGAFKFQRDEKRAAKHKALQAAHKMPTE